jgi:peptidoglycan hydrolase-like protein with peptidoglycan-binding domain
MKWAFFVALLGIALLSNPRKTAAAPSSGAKEPSSSQTKAASKPVSKARKRKTKRAAASSYQSHPDPERYQQIQQALAERGYFKGQVDGNWGDDSVEALKKFQADQKLESDGQINSLTLIGLGLGPKHDIGALSAPPATTSPDTNPPH